MSKEHFQQKKNVEVEMEENLEYSQVVIIVLHFIIMDILKIIKQSLDHSLLQVFKIWLKMCQVKKKIMVIVKLGVLVLILDLSLLLNSQCIQEARNLVHKLHQIYAQSFLLKSQKVVFKPHLKKLINL